MSIQQITTTPIGVEDLALDTPGSEAAPATFNRSKDDGTLESTTKLGADQIPVLDPPILTSSRTPFAIIAANDRDVAECLKTIRINMRDMKNFEHYGGVSGTTTGTTAENNTKAWRKMMDDINTEGRNNGVYFPGATYCFKQISGGAGLYGSTICPFQTSGGTNLGNVIVIGAPGTLLKASSDANASFDLFHLTGGSNYVIADVRMEHITASTTGAIIKVAPASNGIMSNITVDNCNFSEGAVHISSIPGTTAPNYVRDFYIARCGFETANSYGVIMYDVAGGDYLGNKFAGSLGITFDASFTTAWGYYNIFGNRFTRTSGARQTIQALVSGTYNAAVHNSIKVRDNRISSGDISIGDVNVVELHANILYSGGVSVVQSPQVTAGYQIRISKNTVTAGYLTNQEGIYLAFGGQSLRRWWIVENDVYNAFLHGIHIKATGGGANPCQLYGGQVNNNNILDPNQAAGSNHGIYINGTAVGPNLGGVLRTQFCHNFIETPAGSFVDGIRELTGVGHVNNRFWFNQSHGHTGVPVNVNGAGSTDQHNGVSTSQAV